MGSQIDTQKKTAEGLRSRLFDTLDGLIEGKIKTEVVSNVCFISEQILNSAKLELEIEIERERIAKDKREFEYTKLIEASKMIEHVSDSIVDLEEVDE